MESMAMKLYNPDTAVSPRAKLKSFGQWVRKVVMEPMTIEL